MTILGTIGFFVALAVLGRLIEDDATLSFVCAVVMVVLGILAIVGITVALH